MPIKVISYAGYRAEERPKAFILHGQKITVHKILERWREDDKDYFRVVSADRNRYLLCYARRDDIWDAKKLGRTGAYHGQRSV
ncbi:MAG: hypothetical protein GWP10_00325 [Nitrospiraceae bacterium]|nr:hypothetical protein [Nitrospiraceae bacterium]